MTYRQLERWSHLRSTNPVVVNHKKQYPNWSKDKAIPQGWKAVGKEGLKPECLQYVDEVWTDMRPLSLRKKMEGKS